MLQQIIFLLSSPQHIFVALTIVFLPDLPFAYLALQLCSKGKKIKIIYEEYAVKEEEAIF